MQSNRSLRTFIQGEMDAEDEEHALKRPDFVCATQGSDLVIAEIKRPSHELVREDLDQLETYLDLSRKYTGDEYGDMNGYLIGNTADSQAQRIAESRMNIKIKTYNDILTAARERYNEYLDALDEEPGF